jgi:alanine dehydrogenase
MVSQITFGLPRMHKERGEVRDFLPIFLEGLHRNGAQIVVEHGYGSGMGLEEADYLRASPTVRFASHEECYQQNIVLVLRCPEED